jgi:hypothetical protein
MQASFNVIMIPNLNDVGVIMLFLLNWKHIEYILYKIKLQKNEKIQSNYHFLNYVFNYS